MRFLAPEWLILAPVLIVCGIYWAKLRLWEPLRALILILLLAILICPQLKQVGDGLDIWVLVDRSSSASAAIEPKLPEWEELIAQPRGRQDRIFYVDFAAEPILRGNTDSEVFDSNRDKTSIATALQYVLRLRSPRRASRVLLLTDGFSTEPLDGLDAHLVQSGVPLDYRLVVEQSENDYRITDFQVPARVEARESFVVEIEVSGTSDALVPFYLYRDSQRIAGAKVLVSKGKGRVRFADTLSDSGAYRYSVRIQPEDDAFSGNNQAMRWVELDAPRQILLITSYTEDPVARVLEEQGFDVKVVNDPSRISLGSLSGARALILNNVAAHTLEHDFLKEVDFFVRSQGGGFLMLGGGSSFGSGGYLGSPVADLLPVSMELREEHRKLSVAMAVVLDCSGSMGMGVAGGMSKMDLANEGVVQAINMLGPKDEIAVFAVNTKASDRVPLMSLEGNRENIVQTVREIGSGGGGIFVYNGLEAAWNALRESMLGQRHIILFSDAADSEMPGEYKTLLKGLVKRDITVSVIGLGSPRDPDATLLMDISARGKGRLFFAEKAEELPALFVQETGSVARSAFIEEPIGTAGTVEWGEVSPQSLKWPTEVDAYNLNYLKNDASSALLSRDEYKAPLVAFWQRGVGRAAAVSFPLGGPHSERVRSWEEYGKFIKTLVRWTIGSDMAPGIGLKHRLKGNRVELDLFYSEKWAELLTKTAPRIVIGEGNSNKLRELVWERTAPGHYRSSFEIAASARVRGAVQVGDTVLPFGPVSGIVDPEWSFDRDRVHELKAISRLSGGKEIVDLGSVWQAPQKGGFWDLRAVLLVVLLCCFLLEALKTRLDWRYPVVSELSLPQVSLPRFRRGVAKKVQRKPAESVRREDSEEVEVKEEPVAQPDGEEEKIKRRARFARAKRRGK